MTTIAKALQRMEMIKREERDIDPLMPAQTMHVLIIIIAMNPGISMQKLSEKTSLAQSSCSRNVAALSKWHRLGKPGYDLVEAIEDPEDRRQKVIFLTEKGKTRIKRLIGAYNPEIDASDLEMMTARGYERSKRGLKTNA